LIIWPFMAEISQAQTEEQLRQVRILFREYYSELPLQLRSAHFDREIEGLAGEYAPPAGSLLLATVVGQPAGCVGLRPVAGLEGACEMKRLYVRPAFRGDHLGALLVQRIIREARERGYQRLRLDTHPPTMRSAVALYKRFGFVEVTDAKNAVPGLLYMELKL
jgi:GNAT superfamily N-acetyltransferase